MDNSNFLNPSQLSSYAKPAVAPAGPTNTPIPATPAANGLLTPAQLASYAQKSDPTNPASKIGSSWDTFDQAIANGSQSGSLADNTPQAAAQRAATDGSIQPAIDAAKDLGSDWSKRANNIANVFSSSMNGQMLSPVDALIGGAKIAAQATGGIADVFKAGFNALTGVISSFPELQQLANTKGISGALDYIKNAGDEASDISKPAKDAIDAWSAAHPKVASLMSSIGQTALNVGGAEEAPEVAGTAADLAKQGADAAASVVSKTASAAGDAVDATVSAANKINPLAAKTGPLDENMIADNYNKSIKPSVTGKINASQIAQADSKTVNGLQAIADNKPNLEFTDADGNITKGEAPKTVDQLSQSIQQTKQSIFKQYDALAKQAGEKGVTVDVSSIGKELQPIIDSKSLAIANPKAVQYARDLQVRLNSTAPLDAETAQEVIQHYNDSLKAFYKNPNYETASQAGIDSMVANQFRQKLDAGISGATGEQYQALKNQYGALSSMERDVARRAATVAKQSNVGFMANLSSIASGAELVKGLITLNPVDMAISGTIKGISLYNKYLNNPDTGVARIFNEFDRAKTQ